MKFIVSFLTFATASASNQGAADPKHPAVLAHLKANHIKTVREAAMKKNQLQPAKALRLTPTPPGSECDWMTEETCYDENWEVTGCESYESGGCPCPEGEEKCLEPYYEGYCIEPDFCCTEDEELCYDESWNPTGCAASESGGCPCAEGEEKCGAEPDWGYSGYCTDPDFCCTDDEETCYDDDSWEATGCSAIAEGGCPCGEGEEKCGADPEWDYPGYCTTLCCEEQTCFDETTFEPSSCAGWDETCPTYDSFDILKGETLTKLEHTGLKNEIAELNKITAKKAMMLQAKLEVDDMAVEKMIRAKEVAILRKAKHGANNKVSDIKMPAFMKVY